MKKKLGVYFFFFMIFQLLEITRTNEKKNKQWKKNVVQKPFLGYCPNYIVNKKKILLQENDCIVREQLLGCEMGYRKKKFVLQYIKLY